MARLVLQELRQQLGAFGRLLKGRQMAAVREMMEMRMGQFLGQPAADGSVRTRARPGDLR
jgi:hypothetical protein